MKKSIKNLGNSSSQMIFGRRTHTVIGYDGNSMSLWLNCGRKRDAVFMLTCEIKLSAFGAVVS